jgi:hypothetical protein
VAILCHGNVIVDLDVDDWDNTYARIYIYRPTQIGEMWYPSGGTLTRSLPNALDNAARIAFGSGVFSFEWIAPVPDELADFIAKNTGRPAPGRFSSTAVKYTERDGVVWLTPPEATLYDYLKSAGWTFIPQPAVVRGDEGWLGPDFLVFWGGRANQRVN